MALYRAVEMEELNLKSFTNLRMPLTRPTGPLTARSSRTLNEMLSHERTSGFSRPLVTGRQRPWSRRRLPKNRRSFHLMADGVSMRRMSPGVLKCMRGRRRDQATGVRFRLKGGALPRWRAGELVYFDGQYLVSVDVQADPSTLRLGSPERLWPAELPRDIVGTGLGQTLRTHSYALFPDGQRILLMRLSEEQGSVPIVILSNWWTALRQ